MKLQPLKDGPKTASADPIRKGPKPCTVRERSQHYSKQLHDVAQISASSLMASGSASSFGSLNLKKCMMGSRGSVVRENQVTSGCIQGLTNP